MLKVINSISVKVTEINIHLSLSFIKKIHAVKINRNHFGGWDTHR